MRVVVLLPLIFFSNYVQAQGTKHQLRFNERGKFKIVQFTDIHMGEDDEWDVKS
jgi:3',5'-cyclic AMP phosphodiesterase CpdA